MLRPRGPASGSLTFGDGAPGGTRTHDLQVRNLTLYPLSYGRLPENLAEREGFEPSEQVTPLGGLANRCTRPLCDLSSSRGILAFRHLRSLPAEAMNDVHRFMSNASFRCLRFIYATPD